MTSNRTDLEEIKSEIGRAMGCVEGMPGDAPSSAPVDTRRVLYLISQLLDAGEPMLLQDIGLCALRYLVRSYRAETLAARALRIAGSR